MVKHVDRARFHTRERIHLPTEDRTRCHIYGLKALIYKLGGCGRLERVCVQAHRASKLVQAERYTMRLKVARVSQCKNEA